MCQSGCDEDEHLPTPNNGKLSRKSDDDVGRVSFCLKCKVNHPLGSAGGSVAGQFCSDCFRSNLFGKFRLAVTSNGMISPTDNVLVAFSGGPSSRVALQFVHEMQYKAQKNFDASRDRSLPVFGVGAAFIDESTVYPRQSHQYEKAIEDMKLIVSNLSPPAKAFHVVPIERIYSSDSIDGRGKLNGLLKTVVDVTGKEDLLLHLRMLSLQKIALENGYNKLLLGSCTSRIACHVLSATVKGQGYSLPADIQYVDARWDIPVLLPLRDCLVQELNVLCRLDVLRTVDMIGDNQSGINGLVSSFVKLLQEENPSRESTIVRTAEKLTPFYFNKIPDDACLKLQRRLKKFNIKSNHSISSESFCAICYSPLNRSDLLGSNSFEKQESFNAACCLSCQFQILPRDASLYEHFCLLLPKPMTTQGTDDGSGSQSLLREQIQDCLLSDSEDGS